MPTSERGREPTGAYRMSAVKELDTPAVTIRLDIMEDNIRRVQAHLAKHGIGNRPHIKTHKIPAIGKLQMGAGPWASPARRSARSRFSSTRAWRTTSC